LPDLLAYAFDQLAHDDTGLLNVRLAENPEGSGDRHCGACGSCRGHETWPDQWPAMGLLVSIWAQLRGDEVLRGPPRQVAGREIGQNPGSDRSQVR
jgi:hypothetical protein